MKRVRRMKQQLEIGAIYAVPLPHGGFAYVKLLHQAPWRDIAKLYNLRSPEILPIADVTAPL